MTRIGLWFAVAWISCTFVFVATLAQEEDAEGCTISCQNGSICKAGSTSYDNHPTKVNGDPLPFLEETSEQGYYCDCPPNFTGIRCGREFVQCTSDLVCYNGGTCSPDNSSCDCTNAQHNGMATVGKYCEYAVKPTHYCQEGNEQFYCIGEGSSCKSDYQTNSQPCNCRDGYEGLHCQFETTSTTTTTTSTSTSSTTTSTTQDCTLSCPDSATCQVGSANFKDLPTRLDGSKFNFLQQQSQHGQYCDCTDHFTGIQCDIPMQKCNHYDHVCFHGGHCIQGLDSLVANDKHYFCDCSTANFQGQRYIGKYCEERETNRCGSDGSIFCIEHGTCKTNVDFEDTTTVINRPCSCTDGHTGPYCEYETDTVPSCTINDCQNGGVCRLGPRPTQYDDNGNVIPDYWDTHNSYMHCECPQGWVGNKCEVKAEPCGDIGFCYNGGHCMDGVDFDTGKPIFHCNCLHAKDKTNSTVSFAGTYCQIPSTITCSTTMSNQHNGNQFCTNQGSCNTEESHKGCDCPEGFHGPMCEYADFETPPRACDLQCQNGGECRLGPKDTSLLDQLVGTTSATNQEVATLNMTHSSSLMHCVCPEGFFGLTCETRLQICSAPNDNDTNGVIGTHTMASAIEHVCLHGTVCSALRDENGNVHHTCNCDTATEGTKFAGRFCQFSATSHCTENGRPGVGSQKDAFCVNNGECKQTSQLVGGHPGCNCLDGWEGSHCEYPKGNSPETTTSTTTTILDKPTTSKDQVQSNENDNKKDGPSDGAVVIFVLIGLVGLGGVVGLLMPRLVFSRKEFDTAKGDVSTTTGDLEPTIEDLNGTFEGNATSINEGDDPEWNNVSLGPAKSII